MLEFREDLFFASRYFRDSFTIAENAKLKTREIKYPPNLVPSSLSPTRPYEASWERENLRDRVQWRTKFLGQLTRSALIFRPFPLSPKQCCSLYTLHCP